MSENVEAELETRFLRLEDEVEKLISQRIPTLERKIESLEAKTNKLLGICNNLEESLETRANKLLGFCNALEEKMMEIDRKLTRLSFQEKT